MVKIIIYAEYAWWILDLTAHVHGDIWIKVHYTGITLEYACITSKFCNIFSLFIMNKEFVKNRVFFVFSKEKKRKKKNHP
jgi:hypothetical protein